MFQKRLQRLKPAIILLLAILLAACAPSPAAPAQPDPGTDTYTLDIAGVEVRADEEITFTGTTTLPEGACLLSELTRDGEVLPW